MKIWMVYVTMIMYLPQGGLSVSEYLKKAKNSWAEYAERSYNIQGVYTFRTVDNGVPSSTAECFKSFRNKSCNLWIAHVGDCGPNGIVGSWRAQWVRGHNSRYGFELKSGQQGWILTDLELYDTPRPPSSRWPPLLSLGRRCSLGNLPEVMDLPQLQLISLEPLPGTGEAYYTLKCILARQGRTVRASIILDSTHFWCVKNAEFEESIQNVIALRGQVTNRYHVVDGLPIPLERVTVFSSFLSGKQSQHTWKEEFEYSIPQALPNDVEFTLSAFGLPEPYGIEWERPTPWWLYAGMAAGVLVVVIFLLGILKRRLLARG